MAIDPEYAELQLRLARAVASVEGSELSVAVDRCTNFRKRLGLDAPDNGGLVAEWTRFLVGLPTDSLDDQVSWTVGFVPDAGPDRTTSDKIRSGPFSAQVVGLVLRTHFVNSETDGRSPLHSAKLDERRADLCRVVDRARSAHPELERVRGGSWLYATASYRSLFPPAHIETAVVRSGARAFQGSSHWGQFLDHRGGVKSDLRDEFVRRLSGWDGSDPCALFPIPTLEVESPIEVFDGW